MPREEINKTRLDIEQWRRNTLEPTLQRAPLRKSSFQTLSGIQIKDLYAASDTERMNVREDLGLPGQFPYTRGIYASMYRGRPWTIRQVAGFGTAEDTNRRYKYLLEAGETGLSTDFDLPTLLGHDSDHKIFRAEVGKVGVAIDTLRDAELLFEGIPLDKVSTSLTITAPAPVLLAMYEAVGARQGVDAASLDGTIQADILKEYIAQNEYIFPPARSIRLVVDMFEYAADGLPRFHPISISGYHIREAGATAVQELAFTLANGMTYAKAAAARGLDVNRVGRGLSFFFDVHNDFFEEIAKLRAARRMWARFMREKMKLTDPRSWMLRTHCQTAGVSLTAQQPLNNIPRTAFQALAAVLGGTQSLHTNSFDEAYAIPSEKAIKVAVRTQQILLNESGVGEVVDPLAGSYYVEALTNRLEEEALAIIDRIEAMGGMVAAIETGAVQREIADSAMRFQREVESGQRGIVGVNTFRDDEDEDIETFSLDPKVLERQLSRLEEVRRARNSEEVERTLERVWKAARGEENTMPAIAEAVRAYATIGEICGVLREAFGEYRAPAVF